MGHRHGEIHVLRRHPIHHGLNGGVAGGWRDKDRGHVRFIDGLDAVAAQLHAKIDFSGHQGVGTRGIVGDREHFQPVDIGLTFFPVIRVAVEDRAQTRLEFGYDKGARAYRIDEIGCSVLDDGELEQADQYGQVHIRGVKFDDEAVRSVCGDGFDVLRQLPGG